MLNPFLGVPLLADEIPTGHLSDGARSPAEVTPYVRWLSTPHPSVQQWTAAGAYDLFDDPLATRW